MRGGLFCALELDRRRRASLQHQLSDELRQAIIGGRLRPGMRLPSSRRMAEEHRVARNTVVTAFEQLLAEGYLEARGGSGTFVVSALPEQPLQSPRGSSDGKRKPRLASRLSERGQLLARSRVTALETERSPAPFRPGPALDLFPHAPWNRMRSRIARSLAPSLYTYGNTAGYPPLRRAIANYLRVARGVRCEWKQVIVVSGAQQALDLAARLLLEAGDAAIVEDPGYPGARAAFEAAGATLIPIPVDEAGLVIEAPRALPPARLAYVCPSHQYPLGGTLPLRRRLSLLAWARQYRAWILEDDYDSEFRYRGSPLPALQGLDRYDCVLYMGTFSKVLHPALRLGYLVVPPDLIEAFTAVKSIADRQTPLLEQAVLATFMDDGHFGRHVRRVRTAYMERQAVLLQAAHGMLDGVVDVRPTEAGLHLVGWLPAGTSDAAISTALLQAGIECPPLSRHSIEVRPGPGLLLGYAAYNPAEVRRAVRDMAARLQSLDSFRK